MSQTVSRWYIHAEFHFVPPSPRAFMAPLPPHYRTLPDTTTSQTARAPLSSSPPMPKLQDTFAQLRAKKQIALMPFIPAGYPDLATTAACLPALEKAGA